MWTAAPDSSGWVRPAFTLSFCREHEIRWRTTGSLILIHLLTLGNGPEPISPFLVYLLLAAASRQDKSLVAGDALISLGSLHELDAGISKAVQPWMLLKASDDILALSDSQARPQIASIQFLLAAFDLQVSADI
jgi:hypothetical protein